MTAMLRSTGQIELPAELREQLSLAAGDDFEVEVEDDDTITLRRVSQPANRGLVDLLLNCPAPFDLPAREADDSVAPGL